MFTDILNDVGVGNGVSVCVTRPLMLQNAATGISITAFSLDCRHFHLKLHHSTCAPKLTRAVLGFATERKNNVDPSLRSQKKVNYDKLVSCTCNFRV